MKRIILIASFIFGGPVKRPKAEIRKVPPPQPLAQTFSIPTTTNDNSAMRGADDGDFKGGVFLTSVDLFFFGKDVFFQQETNKINSSIPIGTPLEQIPPEINQTLTQLREKFNEDRSSLEKECAKEIDVIKK